MLDLDTWQEIGETVRRNKMRAALTAAGVFWGMLMLVLMLGFGAGLEKGVRKDMGDFATNSVFLWGQRTSLPYKGQQPGRWIGFTTDDAAALAELPGVAALCPRNQLGGFRGGAAVSRGSKTGSFQVSGDSPDILKIQPLVVDEGRFLNPFDLAQDRKVAVIGRQVYAELFPGEESAIGQSIEVRGVFFTVVGLFHAGGGGDQAERLNGSIYLPFTTFQRAFGMGEDVGWFSILVEPGVPASDVEEDVKALLAARHQVDPADEQAIGSWNAEEDFGQIQALFGGIRMLVWVVGVATLLTGVVGVSNILLIVVRERTREIGVRRAIGATRASIVGEILQESVALTAVAGYSGLVVGVLLLEALGAALGGSEDAVLSEPRVDLGAALAAAAVLLVCGLIAGLLPAWRAASIHPVEALRGE